MSLLIKATKIEDWFNSKKREAQGKLPHLVRRLINATVKLCNLKELRMPVDDQINLPGYDGVVETTLETHPYIPAGRSVWEMGTGPPDVKASEDIKKRSEDPKGIEPSKSTFVFVTPRILDSRSDWVARKKEEANSWHDFKAIDAVDLENWLEYAPAVERWLASLMGISVGGIRDIETYLSEELDARYGVGIPPELVISGREEQKSELMEWLDSESRIKRIEGETIEEAIAFVAAVIQLLSIDKKESVSSRLLFIEQPENIDQLSSFDTPHYLVALTSEVRLRAEAKAKQVEHFKIIAPMAKPANEAIKTKPAIKLGSIRRLACEEALKSMGQTPQKANKIAIESKGSLTAVLWMVAEEHDILLNWAEGEVALALVPLLLAGQWSTSQEADIAAVSKLADRSYEKIDRLVHKWATPNGPFIERGSNWDWLAWPYAFTRLLHLINGNILDRFFNTAMEVLSTPDPSLELEPDKRPNAELYGKKHPFSRSLRLGLVSSIAMIAIYSSELKNFDGQGLANRFVVELLGGNRFLVKTTWLSVALWLPHFAEAAPDSFLKVLDEFIDNADALTAIYEEEGFWGINRQLYIIWALERLAWSEDYLSRVTLALGQLATLGHGKKDSDSPASTLKQIYLPWRPSTMASVSDRLNAIELLYERYPEIAWVTAVALLPENTTISMSTSKPEWRPWGAEQDNGVTTQDYWHFIDQLIEKMMIWAGNSGKWWSDLLQNYGDIRHNNSILADKLLSKMYSLDPKLFDETSSNYFSETLRKVIFHHREYPEAEWAMNEESLLPLDELFKRFQPVDPIKKHSWLFASWPDISEKENLDYDELQEVILRKRKKALLEILKIYRIEDLDIMAETVERPDAIGSVLACCEIDECREEKFINRTLSIVPVKNKAPAKLDMGWGYVKQRYRSLGSDWLNTILSNDNVHWDKTLYANLAIGLPLEKATWDLLHQWCPEAEKIYWEHVLIYGLGNYQNDTQYAVEKLLQVGRPYCAISLANMSILGSRRPTEVQNDLPVSTDTIIKILKEAIDYNPDEEWPPISFNSVVLYVGRLLDVLENNGVDKSILSMLEWQWLKPLEHTKRGLRFLPNELSSNPHLFVEILKLVFKPREEAPRTFTEDEKVWAEQGYRLLNKWRCIPGQISEQPVDKSFEGDITFNTGSVDEERLFDWVHEALTIADKFRLKDVCEEQIGMLLAHAPTDIDGSWPCEPVRKLIEDMKSENLEDGIAVGVYNKRGAYLLKKGGEIDRQLEKKFRSYKELVKSKWPRTYAILNKIADRYKWEASEEDKRRFFEEFE